MGLRVSGKNFSIGEALREHVLNRINGASSRYFDGAVTGHIVVDHEGSGYRTDCTLHLTSGTTLHAEGRAQEPYASFEQAAERLENRLRRYKRRLKDHHAGGSQNHAGATDVEMVADYVLQGPDEEDAGTEFHPVVVAERTRALKTFSVAEAVMELDFTGAPVQVFKNAGHGRVNIVYRRPDGNVGWIDPSPLDGASDGSGR